MGGRRNQRTLATIAAGLGAVGTIVVVVLLAGGGGPPGRTPTATTGPDAGSPQALPKRIHPRGRRDRVRRADGRSRYDKPAAGTGALLGIADQKPETFSDTRFRSLGAVRSRLNTPWNSIFSEPGRLGAWLTAARAAGVEPLVAFERARGSNCPGAPCALPPVAAYRQALRAFRARYPWVTLLQPWNEANSATQPTGKHPERAAAYYEAALGLCPTCTITGADLLDSTNLPRWLRRFKAALRGRAPRLWGLHNYSDVNHFRDTGTRSLLGLVRGEVWLTETGGIVSFVTADRRTGLPYDESRAARAMRFMFRLAARFPRITRIYVYQWKIDFPGNRFDAGLVGPNGGPRPAYAEVARRRALLR